MDENDDSLTSVPFEDRPDDFFCSVSFALTDLGISIGDLAALVEQYGIYGADAYGKVGYHDGKSSAAEIALSALRAQQEHLHSDGSIVSPMDFDEGDTPYSQMGWFKRDLRAIRKKRTRQKHIEPVDQRQFRSQIHIIGALLEVIRGDDVVPRSVDFHAKLTHHFHRILTHPDS